MKKFKNGQKVQCVKTKEVGRIIYGEDFNEKSVYLIKWYKSGKMEAFVNENTLQEFAEESKVQQFFNDFFGSEKSEKAIKNILKFIFAVIVSAFLALIFNM